MLKRLYHVKYSLLFFRITVFLEFSDSLRVNVDEIFKQQHRFTDVIRAVKETKEQQVCKLLRSKNGITKKKVFSESKIRAKLFAKSTDSKTYIYPLSNRLHVGTGVIQIIASLLK